jgi:hypothetical protein
VSLFAFGRGDILALYENVSTRRLIQADHMFEQCAFAGAGTAENHKYFTGTDREM